MRREGARAVFALKRLADYAYNKAPAILFIGHLDVFIDIDSLQESLASKLVISNICIEEM